MKQMIKALKPCAALAFFCLVLFFAQALCGLALPALMGGLVNRGVQQGGLEPGAPEAMSLQGKTLLQSFLTEEQQRLLEELYLTVESESSEAQRLSEKYPYAQEGTISVLREGLEEARVQEAGELYEKAVYALLLYLRQTEQTGELNTISQGLAAAREEKKEIGKFGDNLRDLEGKEGSLPNGVLTSMPEGALFQLPEESSFAEAESSSEAEAETMLGSQEKAFGEENANNGEKAGSGKENTEKQSFAFSEVGFSKLDIEQLYALLPLLDRAPRESMETVISAAEEAPRALKERVGVSFKSLLYQELRMDTEAIRSGYLWGRGRLVLGLFLWETARAVLAGLLSFRAADQTAGGRKSWALSALGLPAAGCALPTFAGALILAVKWGTAVRWGIVAGFAAVLAMLVWALLKAALPRFLVLQQAKEKGKQVSERVFSRLLRKCPENGEAAGEGEKKALPLLRVGASLSMPALMLLMNLICLIFVGAEGEGLAAAARRAGDRMAFVQYVVLLVLSALWIAAFLALSARGKEPRRQVWGLLGKNTEPPEAEEFSAKKGEG